MDRVVPDKDEPYKKLASRLDGVPFSDVIKIISKIEDGKYRVLPWIKHITSDREIIGLNDLCRCCRTETLSLPYCHNISDNLLVNLPYIKSLTINADNSIGLNSDVFAHLGYLEELQIISNDYDHPDRLLTKNTVNRLEKIKYLHLYNNDLVDDDFHTMPNLLALVIESRNPALTPNIINFLGRLELCVINGVIYRYKNASEKTAKILKQLSKVKKLKIYDSGI